MPPRLSHVLVRLSSLLVIAGLLASCASPTPAPAPTAVPPTATSEPTATPVPPTDTPIPTATSTSTPVPPTNTPAPTNTPRPTNTSTPAPTKVVTPKPTNTKAPVVNTGGVSSQPSTVQKSVQQTFDTVHDMLSVLDQMQTGGGAELCAPLLAKYQSVSAAPVYDVSGQPAAVQQAYDLYRSAISSIDTRAALFLDCDKTGEVISGLNWSETRRLVDKALGLLGQAVQKLINLSNQTTMSPIAAAIARFRTSLDGIAGVLDQHLGAHWQTPLRGRDPDCAELRSHHAAIQPQEFDVTGQPQSVVNAYQAYRQALDNYTSKISGVAGMCANPDYELNPRPMSYIRTDLLNIIISVKAAQQTLGQ